MCYNIKLINLFLTTDLSNYISTFRFITRYFINMNQFNFAFLVLIQLTLLTGCFNSIPFDKGQKWLGTYTCDLDEYNIELEITEVQNPVVKGILSEKKDEYFGSFNVLGEYNSKTKQIEFKAMNWIFKPKDKLFNKATLVDFKGYILKNPYRFEGEIISEGNECTGFNFTLKP